MTSHASSVRERFALVVLAVILLAGIAWGLHPQYSWDVDNAAPGSVMRAIAAKFGPRWSSSYGPVPYALMAAPMLPLLAFFKLTNELGQPTASYPWGFAHPLWSVNALTLAARAMTVLLAWTIGWMAARETRPADARAAWLAPLLLAGSATFIYYGRTSNVDLYYLVWAWAGFHVVERATRLRGLAVGAAFAALAVCSKEQSGPLAVVIVALATWRAFRGVAPAGPRGPLAALVPGAAAVFAYVLAWRLPFGLPGWREHHRFLFEEATYPRTFPATLEGSLHLAMRAASWLPLALGWAALAGVALALVTRASWRGLGARVVACALYLGAFLGGIGYVYPRFLLPLLLVAVPLTVRAVSALTTRPGWSRPAMGSLVLLACLGGPALTWTQWNDSRLVIERRLRQPEYADAVVELAGNPHFQARVPAERLRITSPDSLRTAPRAPFGDIVLVSGQDAFAFERDAVVGPAWWRPLHESGAYEAPEVITGPWISRFVSGLPVSPRVEWWSRRGEP